jgi:uncharacterized repeat protein (TIGR03803 family)
MKKLHMLISTVLGVAVVAIALPIANAQTYTVLHTFTGSPDGVYPSPLIRDAEGNLYGTAEAGGNNTTNCLGGCGMVYKIDTAGNLSVLYNFAGGSNGAYPLAALARDASGNLYGTTQGLGTFNLSVVFKLTADGQETSFAAPEGSLNAPVVVDAKGNLYGMTPYGGSPNCGWDREELGCGTLFVMTPNGKFTIVHNFTGTDGMFPQSGLVRDSKGNFYGAAVFGGIRSCRTVGNGRDNSASGCGTIFKVDVHGNFSVLYTFTGQSDGSGPLGVIIDSEGNLYGIAAGGGDLQGNCCGYGTIFKLDTNTGVYSVLFTFTPEIPGSNPLVTNLLARDPKGNFYGAQWTGGAHGTGFLFRLDTAGNYADLFDFQEQSNGINEDGFFPNGIVLGSAGDVYGSMSMGGFSGFGTVFHITP